MDHEYIKYIIMYHIRCLELAPPSFCRCLRENGSHKTKKNMWDKVRGVIGILQKGILLNLLNCHAIGTPPFLDAFPTEHGRLSETPIQAGASGAGNVVNWPKRRWINDENTALPVAPSLRKMAKGWKGTGDLWRSLMATGTVPNHQLPKYKDIKMPSTEHRYLEVLEGGMLVSQTVLDSEWAWWTCGGRWTSWII